MFINSKLVLYVIDKVTMFRVAKFLKDKKATIV